MKCQSFILYSNYSYTNFTVNAKHSNSTLPVTLWGDRSTAFDAEKIYKDGQTKPQVVVIVGTLVRDYAGIGKFPYAY